VKQLAIYNVEIKINYPLSKSVKLKFRGIALFERQVYSQNDEFVSAISLPEMTFFLMIDWQVQLNLGQ